jgi:hypothetical protein
MEKGNQYAHSLTSSRSVPSLRSQYTIIGTGPIDNQNQKLSGVLSLVNTTTDNQYNSSATSRPLSQSPMVNEVPSNYDNSSNAPNRQLSQSMVNDMPNNYANSSTAPVRTLSQSLVNEGPSNYENSSNAPNRQLSQSMVNDMPNNYANSSTAPVRPSSQVFINNMMSDNYANSIAPSRPSSQNSFLSQTSYAPSIMERYVSDEIPTKDNFDFLYEKFIKKYHSNNSCRIPDHINKFNDSPTYQKKTFCTFELFLIVKDCGGINKVSFY